MGTTGLLILSNLSRIPYLLSASRKHVNQTLYIQLHLKNRPNPPVRYGQIITEIYSTSVKYCANLDVRVLVSNLRSQQLNWQSRSPVDIVLYEQNADLEAIFHYSTGLNTVQIEDDGKTEVRKDLLLENSDDNMVDSVVLGGTFDRLHVGHKILLAHAVIRAKKRLVVGVTNENMIKSKKLRELILPVETRIEEVRQFLTDIDDSLIYEVVPINDPFGPTITDPDLDLIVVSAETMKGGAMVNEARKKAGMKELNVHCIKLVEMEPEDKEKETKVSSSNRRMDLLGTKIKQPEAKPHLPDLPYVIGLVGGIASGKSVMCKRLEKFGAKVIDCDKLAHQLYQPGEVCYQPIIDHFGNQVVAEDGTINRKVLGQIVFSDLKQLEVLNGIVWPAIGMTVKQKVKSAYEKEGFKVVVIEAAVLLKAGLDKDCHEIWSLIIPPEEALKRIMERDNIPEEAAKQRINSQVDNSVLVAHSNVVFSSLWSHDFTQSQANKAWKHLMEHLDQFQAKPQSKI